MKIYEELFYNLASTQTTQAAKMMRAALRTTMTKPLIEIESTAQKNNKQAVRQLLFEIISKNG